MYLINCMGYIHGPFWSLIIGPHLLLFYRQGDILLNKYFFSFYFRRIQQG